MARKAAVRRKPAKFGRVNEVRDGEKRVLVVCEGECSEPLYLSELRQDLRLYGLDVRGEECGSDPRSVVAYGVSEFKKDGGFDELFCVIDRDDHQTFYDAVQRAEQEIRNGLPVTLIISYPCFEIWCLLHYRSTRKPFVASGGRTATEVLISELGEHYVDYKKGKGGVWRSLRPLLPKAMKNAASTHKQADTDGERNSSTNMYVLLHRLFELSGMEID